VPRAVSVAKEFVRLSFAGTEPDPLTNLRLQKLLYYAQSWALVVREGELFPETLEAWRNGPVVPEVYRAFPQGFGAAPILDGAFADVPDLPATEAEFVRRVWEAYKGHSATQLAAMTHQELPWQKAWGTRPSDGNGNDPITADDMEAYFAKVAMPAPLAEYEHTLRREEEQARELLATLPQLDPAWLAGATNAWSESSRR